MTSMETTINTSYNNLWGAVGCYDPCVVDGKTVCAEGTSNVLTSLPDVMGEEAFWVGVFSGL